MMRLKLVTAPAAEPVTTTEAENQLYLGAGEDTTKLTSLISAARLRAEEFCDRAFINQTWELTLDRFPRRTNANPYAEIYLPKGKIQSITTVQYYDTDDSIQTLDAENYWVIEDDKKSTIRVKEDWPDIKERPGAVVITYIAGYGTSLSTQYESIKQAILLDVADYYENRQSQNYQNVSENKAYYALLQPHRIDYFYRYLNEE